MPDGTIIFSTALDNAQLEEDLRSLDDEIEKGEASIADMQKKQAAKVKERDAAYKTLGEETAAYKKELASLSALEAKQSPLISRLETVREKIEQAKREMERYNTESATAQGPNASDQAWSATMSRKVDLEKQYAEILSEIEKIDPEIQKANKKIEEQTERVTQAEIAWSNAKHEARNLKMEIDSAGKNLDELKQKAGEVLQQIESSANNTKELQAEIDASADSADRFGEGMSAVNSRIDKLTARISKLASRVFIFSMITTALRSLRTYLGKVIQTNDEASSAFAKLKGALLTLAQPLIEILIPALTLLANILTRVVTAIASVLSALTGKTLSQTTAAAKALNSEVEGLDNVGDAAEKASGSLASFDEVNQLSEASAAGESGGSSGIGTDFDISTTEGDMDGLLTIVELIGAALAAWKISSALGLGLQGFLGLLVAIVSTIEFAKALWDAWQNGVDWDNMNQMLLWLAAAVVGLYIAFGPVAAAIAMVVGGLAILATGFHDAMENGWNLQNTLLSIAGILITGIGIGALTGSFIPLLIAGIAAALLALTVATGHGEELIEGVRNVCQGFLDFVTGIFSGDIEKALGGVATMFEGFKGVVSAVIAGVRDSLLSLLDWIDEKTNGWFRPLINLLKSMVNGFFNTMIETASGVIDGAKLIFSGLVKFIAGVFTGDWEAAWEGIKDIFKGVWNGVVSLLEGACNLIIRGVNWLISKLNTISFTVPDWVPAIGGKSYGINIPKFREFEIPRLAQGAVIPPNREFLAVLGDQKQGTNIEAPASLIKQMVSEAMKEMGGMGGRPIYITLTLDGKVVGQTAVNYINGQAKQGNYVLTGAV